MLVCLVSTLVRVLEAKAIGLPSWMRAAPRLYSQASFCITMGSVQSIYASVVLSSMKHINCLSQWNLWIGSSPSVIFVLKKYGLGSQAGKEELQIRNQA